MQVGCAIVAVLLHYLFLSAFCWMLCEGIILFLMLVVVFSSMSKQIWPFLLIGYGTVQHSQSNSITHIISILYLLTHCSGTHSHCCHHSWSEIRALWSQRCLWRTAIVRTQDILCDLVFIYFNTLIAAGFRQTRELYLAL